MRPFTHHTSFKIVALTASLIAVPFAGAYAAQSHEHGDGAEVQTQPLFVGPRIDGIVNQLHGIRDGIADARQAATITPAEANKLQMRAAKINRAAEQVASADKGRIPASQYHRLLRQVDHLNQSLLVKTGGAFDSGNGTGVGPYPKG